MRLASRSAQQRSMAQPPLINRLRVERKKERASERASRREDAPKIICGPLRARTRGAWLRLRDSARLLQLSPSPAVPLEARE